MRKRLMAAGAAALLGAIAIGEITVATPAAGVTSTTIASGSLDPFFLNIKTGDWKAEMRTKGQTNLTVVENRVAPGGSFGWHSHPGPSLIIIKAGAMTFFRGDDPTCTPDVRVVGDAFVDKGTDVHIGRNLGTVEAIVIVTRLVPEGAPTRIDEADPGFDC